MSKLTFNIICVCLGTVSAVLEGVRLVKTIKTINQQNKAES